MTLQQWQQKMENLQSQVTTSTLPALDNKLGQVMLSFFLANFDQGGYEPGTSLVPWSERKFGLDHRALNKTGFLRSRFQVSQAANGTVEITNDAPYAQYIHDGTDKLPARPLLYESQDLNAQITALISQELGNLFTF